MKDNILNLPSDVLGDIFKEIYSEYEKSIRKMFSAPPCEIEITAQQVAKAFDKRGLIEYAPQLYIFVAGVFIGIKDRCNPYQEINEWVAAYRMAKEMNVDVSVINPKKAFEYYQQKNK